MSTEKLPRLLWQHPNPKSTEMYMFMEEANKKHALKLETFQDLYNWSCDHRSQFYAHLFEFANIIYTGSYSQVVDESAPIDSILRWFNGVQLNWAENLLYSRTSSDPNNHHGMNGKENYKVAITEIREGKSSLREISWRDLRHKAGVLASAMGVKGVTKGDRIVVVGANSIDTCLVFIASTWLGAIFSSSSTDMGVSGILQRTTLVNPKYIFFDDGALYNGKFVDLRDKMARVVAGMEMCDQFKGIISISRFQDAADISHIPKTETWGNFLENALLHPPPFVQCDFDDPFLICFSSGTTGHPKAIVHAVGNLIISLIKEGRLHEGINSDTVGLQYTTTGWIMYLANVAQLLSGARAVMYDGSPFQPNLTTFIRIMSEQKITKLGTSPRWLLEMVKNGIAPKKIANLDSLQIVTTTGMVLSEQLFEWFYDTGFPRHVRLANISGGTDIAGCFGQENPLTPLYVGGTQGPSLGVPIAIYGPDGQNGPGRALPNGVPGELVATAAFPNIPVFFWGDKHPSSADKSRSVAVTNTAPPNSKYHDSYFARFDNVWAHGDFCVIHPQTGNVGFLGRADGVLNPSGVRFGSAEIYKVIERNFADRVADSLCVGQKRPTDEDESVMLFLLMRSEHKFDRKLVADVREVVKRELTKRHVPKWIFETPEIPSTVNGKKVELPVKQIVSGYKVKPSGTLLNPESLHFYYQFCEVEKLVDLKSRL